jgi:N-acetylmuramoyl-L-alanine amidase CwlA
MMYKEYSIIKKHIAYNHNHGQYIKPVGVVLHSTATPGATDEAEYKYFNSANRSASAHTFIDWDSITELVYVEPGKVERAWHAGKTANDSYIGVELCEPSGNSLDSSAFNEVWDRAVWYFAHLFIDILGVTAVTKDRLMSHAEVSAKWKESNHQDPVAYFKKYGRTVDDFRLAVQKRIDYTVEQASRIKVIVDGKHVEFTDAEPIISQNRVYVPVRAISEALGKTVAWDAKARTVTIKSEE